MRNKSYTRTLYYGLPHHITLLVRSTSTYCTCRLLRVPVVWSTTRSLSRAIRTIRVYTVQCTVLNYSRPVNPCIPLHTLASLHRQYLYRYIPGTGTSTSTLQVYTGTTRTGKALLNNVQKVCKDTYHTGKIYLYLYRYSRAYCA